MPTIRVQPEPFDFGVEMAALLAGRTDIGGIGSFIGIVRSTSPINVVRSTSPINVVRSTSPISVVRSTSPAESGGAAADDPLAALTLEHYPGMTERALAAIAAEAESRWHLLGCTVIHRIGRLRPGEPIVLVLAASAHREPALAATAFLIDWLKTRAPFWKAEETVDGARRWVQARAADDEAAARWDA